MQAPKKRNEHAPDLSDDEKGELAEIEDLKKIAMIDSAMLQAMMVRSQVRLADAAEDIAAALEDILQCLNAPKT